MEFGRQLFGYRRSVVDKYVADREAAVTSLRLELERLRSAEPLLSAADEVSSLLTSFAVAVSTTREQAERDAIATRRAADEYAEALKAETLRQCTEERARAAAEADEMLRRSREDVASVQRAQERVEAALGEAARGIFSLMELMEHNRAQAAPGTAVGGPGEAAPPVAPGGAAGRSAPPAAGPDGPETGLQGGYPFEEVRVDPRDGMVVHFAPPPDQGARPPAWRPRGPEDAEARPHAVSGEGEPQWHHPGHEGAGTAEGGREQERPPPGQP